MDGRRIRLWLDNEKVAETTSAFRAADAFPPGVDRHMHGEEITRRNVLEINTIRQEIKAVRLKTAMSERSDKYMALRSLTGLNGSYEGVPEKRMRDRLLPPMSEHRGQLTSSLARQQESWHTRVDWDRRTRWEQPGKELLPMMKRWLHRQRGPVIPADEEGDLFTPNSVRRW